MNATRAARLLCSDPEPACGWAHRSVAHIRREDLRLSDIKAEFIEGRTIGPVRDGRSP